MNVFRRLGVFIENRRLLIIIVSVVLIGASVFGALRLTMASGIETYLSPGSQTYKDYARFNQHFGSSAIVVLVTGTDLQQLLQIDELQAMEAVENEMAGDPNVLSAIGPAFLIKQAVAQQTGQPVLPTDHQVIWATVVDPQTSQVRPEFKSIFPDDKHALIAIVLKGDLTLDEQKAVAGNVENIVATAGFAGVEPIVTGLPILMSQMDDMMQTSLRNMFLAVIFSVRGFFAWRWLPLGVVVIGIIYTFGAMGVLSVPITMVSMAVFPILIGLGVDYAIQFHNRYDEEARRGETVADAIIDSVTHIGPAIGIAIIAACLGFAALFFSPVPMIRDFGSMLIIGVIACYLVAMFLLLAILYWRDRRAAARATVSEGRSRPKGEHVGLVERGLQSLAPRVIRNPAIIIPVALVLTVGGLISDSYIKTETDEAKFISPDVPAFQNLQALEAMVGGISPTNVLVEAGDVTDPAILAWMVQLEQRISTERASTVIATSSVADLVLQANGGVMPQSSEQVRQILERMPVPMKRNLVSDDYTAANRGGQHQAVRDRPDEGIQGAVDH